MFDNTRKIRPKCFQHWKVAFFWKLSIFNNHLDPKNFPVISTVIVKLGGGLFRNVAGCLWHPMIPETMGQKHLSSWKQLLFEMFVSIDLLGPKEMVLLIAQ